MRPQQAPAVTLVMDTIERAYGLTSQNLTSLHRLVLDELRPVSVFALQPPFSGLMRPTRAVPWQGVAY
jgi:hypothetical protein